MRCDPSNGARPARSRGDDPAERQAMTALAFMDGVWRGRHGPSSPRARSTGWTPDRAHRPVPRGHREGHRRPRLRRCRQGQLQRVRHHLDSSAARIEARSAPWMLRALPDACRTVAGRRGDAHRRARAGPDEAMHLSYAIQWFGFALIISLGSLALARRRGRGLERAESVPEKIRSPRPRRRSPTPVGDSPKGTRPRAPPSVRRQRRAHRAHRVARQGPARGGAA